MYSYIYVYANNLFVFAYIYGLLKFDYDSYDNTCINDAVFLGVVNA